MPPPAPFGWPFANPTAVGPCPSVPSRRKARRAFLHTVRAVIGLGGQRVDATAHDDLPREAARFPQLDQHRFSRFSVVRDWLSRSVPHPGVAW